MNRYHRALALLASCVALGCEIQPRDGVCRESAERLSGPHPYSYCDERGVMEVHGDFAICHCPTHAKDAGR